MTAMTDTPTVLKKIIARKWEEIAERKKHTGLSEMMVKATEQSPARGFYAALKRKVDAGQSAVIAEILSVPF